MRGALQPARLQPVVRKDQRCERELRRGDLGVGHLRKILALQNLARRDRHSRLELQLGLLRHPARGSGPSASRARVSASFSFSGSPGFGGATGESMAIIFSKSPRWPPEEVERRLEQRAMLALLHEDGVEGPVEILARSEAGGLHGRGSRRSPRPARPAAPPCAARARRTRCCQRSARRIEARRR